MSNGLVILILTLFLINSIIGRPQDADRILGGIRAPRDKFPCFGQLFVHFHETFIRICGSTLIHPEWIMSAAHCFRAQEYSWVRLGTNLFNHSDGVAKNITSVHIHPGYVFEEAPNKTVIKLLNDIAVAKLHERYELNKYIYPTPLPNKNAHLCKTGTVVGIGMVGLTTYSKHLRYYNIESKTREELGDPNLFNPSKTIFYTEMKSDTQGLPSVGDPGGPFLCQVGDNTVQFGVITAMARDHTRNTSQIIYESTIAHMDFIQKFVQVKINHARSQKYVPQQAIIKSRSKASSQTFSMHIFDLLVMLLNIM